MLLKREVVKSRTLVLTFDDGPSDRLTPTILKILDEYDVKATFFLLGRNIVGQEAIVKQIAAKGHDICSHGYDHINYWNVSPIRSVTDIVRGWRAIDNALETSRGKYPFRPSYGKLNIVCLLYLLIRKVPIVNWSLDLGDVRRGFSRDSRRLASKAKQAGGAVVLAHDFERRDESIRDFVLESLRSVLSMACATEMRVLTLSELFAETNSVSRT